MDARWNNKLRQFIQCKTKKLLCYSSDVPFEMTQFFLLKLHCILASFSGGSDVIKWRNCCVRFAEDRLRSAKGAGRRRERFRALQRSRQTEGDVYLLDLVSQRDDTVERRGHRRLLDGHQGTCLTGAMWRNGTRFQSDDMGPMWWSRLLVR